MNGPKLQHRAEFERILANYKVSSKAKMILDDLRLLLFLAPTSTGRSLITRQLLKTGHYHYIISDTTRSPQVRDGKLEQHGVQYFFRQELDFLKDLKAGNFLEAELVHNQQVSGISMRELEKAAKSGKIAFTETDIVGVINIKLAKPDTVTVFLLPPSFGEWQNRIKSRGGLTQDEILRRLRTAEEFFEAAPKYDYLQFVIADDPARSAKVIDEIMSGQPNPDQKEGEELAQTLLTELREVIH